MTIVCYIGSVGSGKTTMTKEFVKKHPNDPCVLFLPGQILRGAMGSARFGASDGNAPRCCDDFVFSSFLQHLQLARAIGAVTVVTDGWPRTALQASAFVMWLHRTSNGSVVVHPHHLICSEAEWERRLKGDRWLQNPELEAIDRQRYAQSIEDSLGSISVLRTMGEPFVNDVQVHVEVTTP